MNALLSEFRKTNSSNPFPCSICDSNRVKTLPCLTRLYCQQCQATFLLPPAKARLEQQASEISELEQAQELLTLMVAALTEPNVKKELDQVLRQAQGDLHQILETYLPRISRLLHSPIARFGFPASMTGIATALIWITHQLRHEPLESYGPLLVILRQRCCPTGTWVAEEDLAAAEETQRRQDLRVAAKEAAEAADLALARERAEASSRKKRTLGLDPESCSLPEILVDLPDHVSVLARGSLQMKVELKAHPLPVTYRWFFRSATSVSSNFTQIPMSNSSSLTLKRVTRLMTGQYYVQCSNDDGSTKSSVCVLRLGLIRWTRESFGRSPHVPYAISYQELSKSISTWSGRCLQSWKALDEDHHHHQGKEQWTIRRSISMTNTRVVAFSTTHVATLTSDTSFSVRSLAESKGEPFVEIVKKTRAKIKMICWANFGQWLITCDAQSFVSVYDIQSTNHRPIIRQRLTSPDETIDVMAMDSFTHGSDVTVAVAMSTGLQILVFSSTLLECTATHAPMYPKARVTCASWSSCGSILALGQRHGGRQNGTISLISGQTRTTTTRKKKKFRVISQAHLGTIESITWTLNDHVLVSIGQEDGLLKLWGPLPQLECCIGTLECHATGITASYISRNLETVLTCGYDRRLCVWNIRPESQSMIDALGREQDSAARIIQAFLRKNF